MPSHARIATCLTVVLIGLCVGHASAAQEPAPQPDPELVPLHARVKLFLEGISGGGAATAYQDLLANSPLARQDKALKDLIDRTGELNKYGKCHGFEPVDAKRIGQDLVLLRYLYKCEDFPVVWYFGFYRTPRAAGASPETALWRVVSVRFDTRLELLWF